MVAETPFQARNNFQYFWLAAKALKAIHASEDQANCPLGMDAEELAIANRLFSERNTSAGNSPPIWLGAVSAKGLSAAHDVAEELESILPAEMSTGAVRLVPGRPQT